MNKHKNFIWNALGSIMYGLNSFVLLMFVSRTIKDVDVTGDFGIAFTTAQLLFMLGMFGTNFLQITDFKEEFSFKTYKITRIFTGIVMMVICILVVNSLNFNHNKSLYTYLLTIWMLINVVAETYQGLFMQKIRFDLSGKMLFFRTLFSLITFILTLYLSTNLLLSIILMIISNLIISTIFINVFKSKISIENDLLNIINIKKLIGFAAPLFLGSFLMNLLISSSKYNVEFLLSDASQGYYNMIFISAQVINMVSQFIFRPLLNSYSILLKQGETNKVYIKLKKQIMLISLLTLVCSIAIYFLGAFIFTILYSINLDAYKSHMVIIVLGGGVLAICQLFYYMLVLLRKQKLIMCNYIFTLALAFFLGHFLTLKFNIMGASISFLISHLVLLLIYICMFNKSVKKVKV